MNAPGVTVAPPLSSPTAGDAPAASGARLALTVLLLINLFNYIDRQVLAALEPEIRKDFFPDVLNPATGQLMEPDEAKTWMGLLSTAFLVSFMVFAPVFGWLANRTSRWLLVALGVIVWSLASGASGLAHLYLLLLLTRCCVGIGEAVYGPVAPTMIADLYPEKKRGQVISWFYVAIPVGGALGYTLGGEVFRATGSWRTAFFLVVPPGLLLGLWCFFLKDPPRGRSANGDEPGRKETWSDYLILLKTPSFVLNTLGMTAMCFAMGGLAFWAPRYLQERKVEDLFGLEARTAFGAMTALMGLIATLLGGLAGDALRTRFSGSYFLVSGAAMVLSFPMLLLVINLDFPWAWIPLALFVFFLFFNTGPTNTILANVTHPLLRAPGFAVNIFFIHLFGDAISPPIMGAIAGPGSLAPAFSFVAYTVLIGGLLWLWGAQYLERDTRLAPTRLGPEAA